MDKKLKCYEEILTMDPSSKLFFGLAKFYLRDNQIEKAIKTIYRGLENHPEHLEARLLLLRCLLRQGKKGEIKESISYLISVLKRYPEFWQAWADLLEEEEKTDLALALRFIELNLFGEGLSWAECLHDCLKSVKDKQDQEFSTEKTFDRFLLDSSFQEQNKDDKRAIFTDHRDVEKSFQETDNDIDERQEESKGKEKEYVQKNFDQSQVIDKAKCYSGREKIKNKEQLVQRLEKLANRLESKG